MTPHDDELVEALRSSLLEGDQLRRRNDQLSTQLSEPIAIVGMACRLPGGADSPDRWWTQLLEGVDSIGDFPGDRGWVDEPDAQPYPHLGGFLYDAMDFDPAFFGISPREALAMDPQQRLLLEVGWEAIESAGIDPVSLRGSETGVYAGVMYHDYADRLHAVPEQVEGHLRTGSLASVVSGRVAFALGLTGPAVTIDTACSSSLVALHTAAQELRRGGCSMALVGGVTVMSTPKVFAEFAMQGGLAADGRCKSYAAAADGTGWSEGAAVVLVERLSDARRLGHEVLAVLRGSAVNQDGASNGLTAPSRQAQERVIARALSAARLTADDIDLVEGHGTGTRLGDPIEVQALLATYGQGRTRPLLLGSAKSNIGHTQAAAGVAGVIKAVLAMRGGVVPPTLHVDDRTPHADWDSGAIELVTTARSWPETGRPRRAAVSSFGISGTNAHVILESATVGDPAFGDPAFVDPADEPLTPWILSGKTSAALRANAARLGEALAEHPEHTAADIGVSAAVSRSRFGHRAVILGHGRDELESGLAALAADTESSAVHLGSVDPSARVAMLFPGQGAQRVGMGATLAARYPVFAAAFDEVCAHLDATLGRSLRELVIDGAGEPGLLDRTAYAQAALFATEVALFRLIESFGVRPDFLVGHSIGEVSAAYLAEVWSLADATRLVAARGTLMQSLPEGGAMLSIASDEQTVAALIAERSTQVSVAAVNARRSVVISGAEAAVAEIAAHFDAASVKRLRVSHAFHSPLMAPMLDEFAAVCADLTYHPPNIPVVSNRTGERATAAQLCSPEYWVGHVSDPVRFADGLSWLRGSGRVGVFLEVGPGAALSSLVLADDDGSSNAVVAPLLRPAQDEELSVCTALARAFTAGVAVDWAGLPALAGGRRIPLPTYAFEHQRFWLPIEAGAGDVTASGLDAAAHPLLGAEISVADSGRVVLTGVLSTRTHPWLADHRIDGQIVVAGAVFVELLLRAADSVGCDRVDDLIVVAPLTLTGTDDVRVQLVIDQPRDGRYPVTVHAGAGAGWRRHAEATLSAGGELGDRVATDTGSAAPWPPEGAVPVETADFYERLERLGYQYGPLFRGVRGLWRRGDDVFATVAAPDHLDTTRFHLHPALLDAALHGMVDTEPGAPLRLPFGWEGVRLHAVGASVLHVCLTATAPDRLRVTADDTAGRPVLSVDALLLRESAGSDARTRSSAHPLYAVEWIPLPGAALPSTPAAPVPSVADLEGARTAPEHAVLVVASDGTDEPSEVRATTALVMDRVQRFLATERLTDTTLVVVTRGAVAVEVTDTVDLRGAAIWGLLRSAQTENPDRLVLLDIGPDTGLDDAVAATVAAAEPQVAWRGANASVPRMVRHDVIDVADPIRDPHWRLTIGEKGTLTTIGLSRLAEDPVPVLAAGQVRVRMRAAGINFRDVLISIGMYPNPDAVLGGEGAGVVVEVAPDVTDFAPGDRVMGLFDGVGSTVVTDHRTIVRIPEGWSFPQAASVPVVYLTAYYGLLDLAKLRAGQSLLIHAATGGVGTAARQLAKHWGVRVYATASPGKQNVLVADGLSPEQIANSRTLDFEEQFRVATEGNGVDVVLDSLAGEFVDASLRLLPRGGQFVEMGMTDRRDPAAIAAEYPGVGYHSFLVTEVAPDRIAQMLAEIVALFDAGALTPPPVTTWDVRQATSALRFVSQARQVGKVVLTVPPPLDPGHTVMITGGVGTIGAALARHVVAQYGVARLLLTSRRGAETPGAAELVAELREGGAEATVAACDVADRAALAALLDGIDPEHPLGAVIHCAGTVSDAAFEKLTIDDLDRVLPAKVDAAWNLYELTRDLDLSALVLFSSAAGVLGNAGQANYAAGNAYLDGLAVRAARSAVPATSLAWGLWSQSSGVSGHLAQRDLDRMARGGFTPLSTAEALGMFDAALSSGTQASVPMRIDVAAARASATAGSPLPAMLSTIVRMRRSAQSAPVLENTALLLVGRSGADRRRVVSELLARHVATVLGRVADEALEPQQRFVDMGFDSLTTVELRNHLKKSMGVMLSTTVMFDYPTPYALTEHLCGLLASDADSVAPLLGELTALLDRLGAADPSDAERDRAVAGLLDAVQRLRGPQQPDVVGARIDLADDTAIFEFIDSNPASA
ncbi:MULTISPECIES: type I polyketide synthase [Nocardia]|uniref:type I polyketide synthase n=1 Tax=Nocardia TaxID=1817 RepID=UPI000D69AF50|nr:MULTISPECIES: type I polyketide synthase [Nocardia]